MPPRQRVRNFALGVLRLPCTPAPRTTIKKIVCILQCGWCCGTCNSPQRSGVTPPPPLENLPC